MSAAAARRDIADRDVCPKGICDGSGWILGPEDIARPCECRELRRSRRAARGIDSAIPRRYQGVSFDRPPVSEMANDKGRAPVLRAVRAYADEVSAHLEDGRGRWLMGDVGTGKTTLAMLLSRAAIEAGHTVGIYSLPRLLTRIRGTFAEGSDGQGYEELFQRLTSVDLLHLDDLGAERQTEWVLEQLYAIVNERYLAERAMVVTTHLDQASLEQQIGPRTVSRLVEICGDPLPLFGDDLRYRVA